MQLVESAENYPGVCALSGGSGGPFLRLDRLLGPEVAHGGTAYVAVSVVDEMARALGYVPAPEAAVTANAVAELEERAEAAERAHAELLAAVGTTLQHGAVVRKGAIELRKPYARTRRRAA